MSKRVKIDKREVVRALLKKTPQTKERNKMIVDLPDHFYPLHEWPEQYIRMALQPRLGHAERFQLACFILGNGVGPSWLAKWCTSQPGYLRVQSSARDMASMILAHQKGIRLHTPYLLL